uniref:Uncharacterized protein n=1 Tax=Chlamydomonas leiostraca TaxID=1034604 RepID=A0A7S0N765_9CHLO
MAAGCILGVRALAVQLGFYFHMLQALGLPATLQAGSLTPAVKFTVGFMLLFSVVIALFKDVPDSKGDSRAGVRTLTVRLGPTKVFWACIWILTAAYGGACAYSLWAALSHTSGAAAAASAAAGGAAGIWARTAASIAGHLGMAALLWQRAKKVNTERRQDLADCYMYVWKLFYAEYILIPLLL